MNYRRIFAAAVSAVLFAGAADSYIFDVPQAVISSAESSESETESVVHTITFMGFDETTVIGTLEVEDGAEIDYTLIDTSVLSATLGTHSQIRFHSWDQTPETATEDLTIYALSETGTISLDAFPTRTEYFSNTKTIDLSGLVVTITFEVQTPERDEEGNRIVEVNEVDISASCYASPSELSEAFAESERANIAIYPLNAKSSLGNYVIEYFPYLGNVFFDSSVDAIDASYVLSYYSKQSTGQVVELTETEMRCADIDRNGSVNAIDASYILSYYAQKATGQNPDWDNIIS